MESSVSRTNFSHASVHSFVTQNENRRIDNQQSCHYLTNSDECKDRMNPAPKLSRRSHNLPFYINYTP